MTRFTDLVDGYRRFRSNEWKSERERWAELAEGQSPKVMVIACSDSRVEPAIIFDARPGEMFVVRNVANLAPPFETTPGRHGVSAALTGQFDDADHGAGHFIAGWVSLLDEARAGVLSRHGELTEQAFVEMELQAVLVSLANLRTFPWIAEREKDGRLSLHGCHFSIADGKLYLLDEAENTFRPV